MFIIIPTLSKNAILVRGRAEKHAVCETCRCEYSYLITREAVGTDRALFSWDEVDALRKAQADGEGKVQRRLAVEDDPVPCPECGWVQRSMIQAVRRHSYLGLWSCALFGFLLALVGVGLGVIDLILYLSGKGTSMSGSLAIVGGIIAACSAMAGLCFWALRAILNGIYDPNPSDFFSKRE